jgi:hypothetical protein
MVRVQALYQIEMAPLQSVAGRQKSSPWILLVLIALAEFSVSTTCALAQRVSTKQNLHPNFELTSPLTITPDVQPLDFKLTKATKSLSYIQHDATFIFDVYQTIKLSVAQSGSYRIEAASDDGQISGFVTDSNGSFLQSLGDSKRLRSKISNKLSLKSGELYYVVVGGASTANDLTVRIGVFSGDDRGLGPNPHRSYQTLNRTGSYIFNILDSKDRFAGRPAIYYKLDERLKSKWVKIFADADIAWPTGYLYMSLLDNSDNLIREQEYYETSENSESYIIDPAWNVYTIVVSFLDLSSDKAVKPRPLKINLALHGYDFDPRPMWLTNIREPFSDPSLTFLGGLLVSSILGYIFYRKSSRFRRIYFSPLDDIAVIDDKPSSPPLLYTHDPNGENRPLFCASLFRIKFWNGGDVEIPEVATQHPIQFTLHNVVAIRSIRSEKIDKTGWREAIIRPESFNIIEIPFSVLYPDDNIIVTMICEQERLGPIQPEVKIIPGVPIIQFRKLAAEAAKIVIGLFYIFTILSIIFFIIDITGVLDLFSGRIGRMIGNFLQAFYFIAIFILVFIGVFHKSTRRSLIESTRFLVVDPIKRLIVARRARKDQGMG